MDVAAEVKLKRLGRINLPDHFIANPAFGQTDLLVGFYGSSHFYYYQRNSDRFELVWKRLKPEGLKFNCMKHVTRAGEFYLQCQPGEVYVYSPELHRTSVMLSPGLLLSFLPGENLAVVDNCCSSSVRRKGVRLSVTSTKDLCHVHHQLEVPADGPYHRDDLLQVRGLKNGQLVVTVLEEPFCDLYDDKGE